MSPTAPEGPPQGLTCMKCDGTGVVDDGEIDCHPDGTPFTNGPVKCVKDCPKCKGSGIHAFPAPERPAPKNAAGHSIRADLAATAEEFVTIPRSPTIGMLRVLGCTATTFAEMLEEAARANLWNYVAAPEAPPPVEARQPPQSELAKSLAWSNDDGWRAQRLATEFHEIYERLAPIFGYETRPDTKQFDPNSKNGKLMIAVCGNILAALAAPAGAIQRGHLGSTPWGETDDH